MGIGGLDIVGVFGDEIGAVAFFGEIGLAFKDVEIGGSVRETSESGDRGEDANGCGDGIVADLADGIESGIGQFFECYRRLDDAGLADRVEVNGINRGRLEDIAKARGKSVDATDHGEGVVDGGRHGAEADFNDLKDGEFGVLAHGAAVTNDDGPSESVEESLRRLERL